MIVGCFTTHLYCDCAACEKGRGLMRPTELTGETRGETMRQARSMGWKIRKDKAYAPGHKEPSSQRDHDA